MDSNDNIIVEHNIQFIQVHNNARYIVIANVTRLQTTTGTNANAILL